MNTTEVLELNYFFSFFGCKRHRAVPTSLKIAIRLNKVVQKTNTGWTFRICLDMNIGTNIHTIIQHKYSLDYLSTIDICIYLHLQYPRLLISENITLSHYWDTPCFTYEIGWRTDAYRSLHRMWCQKHEKR